MTIKLKKEVEARLIGSIQRYVAENMEEEIGELKARMLLDFCMQEIGASIYNQAIADAHAYMLNKVADMEAECYEVELAYWKK
ncbi:hypothetical protein BH11PSE11_BH11PSE11_00130 [soil metagenome]